MTRLTFALLGASQRGRNPQRSAEWIRDNVEGYGTSSESAFKKKLRRDVRELRLAGVPISQVEGAGGTYYHIDEDSYRLPEVSFTPEEALVLGLAGGVGQHGGLSAFSQTGWTKLAATGATRGQQRVLASNDLTSMDAASSRTLITAITKKLRVTFLYHPRPGAAAEKRVLDPWALVTARGRIYVVGHDVHRGQPRCFRVTKLSDARLSKNKPEFITPSQDPQQVVREFLSPRDLIDATVRIPPATAPELESVGDRDAAEPTLVHFHQVSQDWLVRSAIGYAPEVEVLSPPSARDALAALSKGVAP
ncbi:WYL domain-containing protein [Corynebacterium lizhenjunii]|uniref:WYL domain-containing protein n=1 Tax=Corynebacterium lizhenjunii TaxID=2709394 RepID=A0A7T0PAS0_9CORY|nr:WYL domain-containing protein [Corynebacterium lizhenjunii]QPK80188.1 WYL domain-containing protein [Corynebacterium lizhenjunii]